LNFFQIHANRFSFDALKLVSDCLPLAATGCCPPLPTITEKNCTVTSGTLGEFINDYPLHPDLTG
jgi:hypothetical protein